MEITRNYRESDGSLKQETSVYAEVDPSESRGRELSGEEGSWMLLAVSNAAGIPPTDAVDDVYPALSHFWEPETWALREGVTLLSDDDYGAAILARDSAEESIVAAAALAEQTVATAEVTARASVATKLTALGFTSEEIATLTGVQV